MSWLDIIIYILLGVGVFFNLLGGFGLLRFPDVYTRLHAGTKCTTFGSIFICGAVILMGLKTWYFGSADGSVLAFHTAVALIAILLTNPTGAHAIARAAHRSGVEPYGAVVDDLKEKEKPKAEKEPAEKESARKKEGGQEMITELVQIVTPILIVAASIFAVKFKDLIAAAIAVAAMSLLLSLEFYILQAPDVAIAEAGVGACLTTAILIISIRATRRMEEEG